MRLAIFVVCLFPLLVLADDSQIEHLTEFLLAKDAVCQGRAVASDYRFPIRLQQELHVMERDYQNTKARVIHENPSLWISLTDSERCQAARSEGRKRALRNRFDRYSIGVQ